MIPNQRAEEHVDLMLTKEEWMYAKLAILEIDQQECGFSWLPYDPLTGSGVFKCSSIFI